MSKNLVLFSDGTGNSAGKLFKTNVWRVYQAVDLADPQQPKDPRQFAFYDDGVGTSSFKPLAVLGGAFGFGLARNVRDLYVFLCRTYEPGDKIYAFGFSRGAFTIRVLIGLVMSQGIVRYTGNEADLQRWSADAYRRYRAERFKSKSPLVWIVRPLRNAALRVSGWALRQTPYAKAERFGKPDDPKPVEVQFVGLWDTVDAYGLPVDELTRAIDTFVWPLTMRDYNLNRRVQRARHALALDDERNAFHPRLWNEKEIPGEPGTGTPGGNVHTTHINDEQISQVWFAGVHSNVGGGYADDSLSYVSLLWMVKEADKYGLRFEPHVLAEIKALADENGLLYDSRRGLAGYYRYNPRRIDRLTSTDKVKVPRTKVHESVLRRIHAGHDGYAPIVLPPDFAVMKIDGSIQAADAYLAASGGQLGASGAHGLSPQAWTSSSSTYPERRERVYNAVWWRRVAYFFTLAVTLTMAALPLGLPGTGACDGGRLCALVAPVGVLGVLLPSSAAVWLNSFFSHPVVWLPLVAALILGLAAGGWFAVRVGDLMRSVWYAIPTLQPRSVVKPSAPATAGPFARALQAVRTSASYLGAFKLLTHGVLPLAFLVLLGYAAFAAFAQLSFADAVADGDVCMESGAPSGAAGGLDGAFDAAALCAYTGTKVEKGGTYRVRLTVPGAGRWWDRGIPAGPHGLEATLDPLRAAVMGAGVPLRRHLTEPWFQPMVRIGQKGNDTYALHGDPETPTRSDRRVLASPANEEACSGGRKGAAGAVEVYEALVVARSSGPMFVYVNDAIVPWGLEQRFYKNNCGTATLEIEQVVPLGKAVAAAK
ncbi:MAG: DUF2235 domain-containing protein [Xanthomonadaceae bacterium]|nr:DUF2235 domain-containing protein [Xanthomonadaceae bacterium]